MPFERRPALFRSVGVPPTPRRQPDAVADLRVAPVARAGRGRDAHATEDDPPQPPETRRGSSDLPSASVRPPAPLSCRRPSCPSSSPSPPPARRSRPSSPSSSSAASAALLVLWPAGAGSGSGTCRRRSRRCSSTRPRPARSSRRGLAAVARARGATASAGRPPATRGPRTGLKRLWAANVGIGYASPVGGRRAGLPVQPQGREGHAGLLRRHDRARWSGATGPGRGTSTASYAGTRADADGRRRRDLHLRRRRRGRPPVARRRQAAPGGRTCWPRPARRPPSGARRPARWSPAGRCTCRPAQGGTIAVALDADDRQGRVEERGDRQRRATRRSSWPTSPARRSWSCSRPTRCYGDGPGHRPDDLAGPVEHELRRERDHAGLPRRAPVHHQRLRHGRDDAQGVADRGRAGLARPEERTSRASSRASILEGDLLYGWRATPARSSASTWPGGKRRWRSSDSALNLKLGGVDRPGGRRQARHDEPGRRAEPEPR